ncbi:MAG: SufD family Fe-S cluster assembly protein [Acidimicrobiia bacterium]|nr:SufD family Fe-S cluster assembly protein [Acidimicrobiia bacterium]
MPVLPAFAPDAARDRAAAEAFAAAELPTAEEEVWRYSPIGDLDLARYRLAPVADGPVDVPACAQGVLDLAAGSGSVAIVTVNGRVVHRSAPGGPGGDRVEVGGAEALDGIELPQPTDAFDALNAAFGEPVVVRIPAGASPGPVVVFHYVEGDGIVSLPRLVVDAGPDADVRVLEVVRNTDDADALVIPVTDLLVGKAARVGHLVVQDLGRRAWQLGHQRSRVDADATLTATAAGMGGAYGRQRTDCRLVGRGATGNLRALWFGEDDQRLDFRTFQDHAAPDTTSDLVYKGAVGGRSRSVYTGLIRVEKNARGTNAVQTNRNLKLSDEAWAESVPNLEIHNNDVRCAHASAVGPVDAEQRWYLESRGVPTAAAERLIVAGFFDEVLADLPVGFAEGPIRELVTAKLARVGLA